MKLVEALKASGPKSAASLVELTGRSHESVYAELVREEAAGRARINIDGRHNRTWEAVTLDEETEQA